MGRGGRTGYKGKPAAKKKHQRATYTYEFKYDVLLDSLDGSTMPSSRISHL
jgi:hypothetical protein